MWGSNFSWLNSSLDGRSKFFKDNWSLHILSALLYWQWCRLPSWYLAVVHVGRHNDPCLPFVSLSEHRLKLLGNSFSNCFTFFTIKSADVDLGFTDLAVKNHYIVGFRCQPGLHCFTNSTNPVQGWGVKVRPAIVLHLNRRGGKMFKILVFAWVKPVY